MTKVIIADWNGDNKVIADIRDLTAAEADAKLIVIQPEYPNAFIADHPGGGTRYWVVDAEAQTVTNNQAQADADALASSWDRFRTERNALLASSDWTQSPDSPLDDEAKAEWAVYREELRDLPESADPADPTWPEAPE